MSIQVHVTAHGTDTVIALDGAVDADVLFLLGDGIVSVARGTTGRLLLNIRELTLLDDTGLDDLVDQLLAVADGRIGIIAPRDRARQDLFRSGIPARIPIYDTPPDGDF